MTLSEPFIRRPVMTVVLTVAVILFGVFAYLRLPVNDLPAVDYPVIQVQVSYPGAPPETMANNVATPLERQFMQIPGLELVTSSNGQGTSSFSLQFALSKSLDAAATDVQAAISRAQGQLPSIYLVRLPSPRLTRTISRSYISRSPATRLPPANSMTMQILRWVSVSAFCRASARCRCTARNRQCGSRPIPLRWPLAISPSMT